ncbi:MAG: rRNA methyltransferase [Rariglobus sp.]|jgi:16S rRNA (uracil1498-N3)-methyltransferase|nr:rRNA methyltransferase [Rariglobus sp.]
MSDFRVFAPAPVQGTISLPPGESHHLVTVNRARAGDTVIAFDGRGTEWTCELTDARKAGATLRVTALHTRAPLPCAITLAQALPKGGVMDDIVRHATELGAARIVPLETERTQVHLDGDRSDKKIEKWRIVALEAAKQCGNPFLPEITAVQPLAAFLASDVTRGAQLKLVASLHPGARPLRECTTVFRSEHGCAPATAVWLVGPEGDFSPAEIQAAQAAGFIPVTLGPLVLRCDTAATAAISVLNYELGG